MKRANLRKFTPSNGGSDQGSRNPSSGGDDSAPSNPSSGGGDSAPDNPSSGGGHLSPNTPIESKNFFTNMIELLIKPKPVLMTFLFMCLSIACGALLQSLFPSLNYASGAISFILMAADYYSALIWKKILLYMESRLLSKSKRKARDRYKFRIGISILMIILIILFLSLVWSPGLVGIFSIIFQTAKAAIAASIPPQVLKLCYCREVKRPISADNMV